MQVVNARCAGLDVHKKEVVGCIWITDEQGRATKEVKTFGTMTADILALSDLVEGTPGAAGGDGIDGGVLEADLQPAGG
jgi:hypothetical protein